MEHQIMQISPALSYFLFSDSNSTLPVTKITQSVVNSSEHTYISKVRSFPSLQATYNTSNYQALECNVRITRPISRSYTNLQEKTTTLFPEHVLKALSDVVVHLLESRGIFVACFNVTHATNKYFYTRCILHFALQYHPYHLKIFNTVMLFHFPKNTWVSR
jgi:hypothetical protein